MRIGVFQKTRLDISDITSFLQRNDISFDLVMENDQKEYNLIISIGGDGTTLEAAKYALAYDIPLYALAYGKINFLASGTKEEFFDCFDDIRDQKVQAVSKNVLECVSGDKKSFVVNDCVIKHTDITKVVHLDISLDTKKRIPFRGDGIVISTPFGSTAYNHSVGGAVIIGDSRLYQLSFLAPIQKIRNSLILQDHILEVHSEEDFVVIIDGKKVQEAKSCQLKLADTKLRIFQNPLYLEKVCRYV